jgi:hypothetical protein
MQKSRRNTREQTKTAFLVVEEAAHRTEEKGKQPQSGIHAQQTAAKSPPKTASERNLRC